MVDSGERLREKNAARKEQRKNPVGRPKGGSLAQKKVNELLESKDFEKALEALKKVASDPEHKHWAVAMKEILSRAAHISNYEKAGSNQTPVVNINIGDVQAPVTIEGETVKDG